MKTKVKDNAAISSLFLAAVLAVLMGLASSASAVVTIDTSDFVNEWTVGKLYTCTVTVSSSINPGDNFDWSLVEAFPGDNIPPGLGITDKGNNDRFGELSYTPGLAGTFDFRIKVKQRNAPEDSGFIDVSLVINPTPSYPTANLPDWSYGGDPYYFEMPTPVGGTPGYKWSMKDQPTSLSIDSMTGIISGTIQAGEVRPQAYFVIVTLKDTTGAQFEVGDSVHIYAQPVITTPSPLPQWTATHPYNLQLATNRQDSETLIFSLPWGALPGGLSLGSDGLISGTTSNTGQFQCSVKVEDPKHSMSTKRFTLTINPILQITTTSLKNWSRSTPLSFEYIDTLSTTGGSRGVMTWNTSGTLPPGLSIVKVNASQAVLRGYPSVAGTYNFGLSATDSVNFTSATTFFPAVTINPSLAISTAGTSLPEAVVGDAGYSFTVTASGGTGQRTWKDSLNTLSGVGLRLSSTTAEITANPNVIGPGRTVSVIIRVIDDGGGKAIDTFSLKVDSKPSLSIADRNICEGATIAAVQGTDENTDDVASLSYTLRAGFNNLPGGVAFQPNGQFSGVANYTSAGTYGVQVIVCDPAPNVQCDTASFVITVRNTDRAPVFKDTITNDTQIVYEGESLYRLRADDADNDPLTYTLIGGSLPLGVGSVASNGTFPNPTSYVLGDTLDHEYGAIFRVCDTIQQQCVGGNTSLCDTDTLHFIVRADRVHPHLSWGPTSLLPQTIRVGIADQGAGVDSARIRFRKGNTKGADTLGTETHLTSGNLDSFSVVLPAGSVTSAGLEVKIRMWDLKGNYGDTGWISVPVQYASGSETRTRDEWLGGNDSFWHLVSFPGVFSGNGKSVRTILETLSGLPRANGAREDEWRLYRFLGTQSNQDLWDTLTSEDQSNEVRIGEGYWFRHMMKDFTLTLPAFATASSAAPFPIPLQSGWNLIGNPFFFPLTIHRNSLQQANANSLSDARPADPGDAMAEWQRLLLDDMTAADTAVLEPFKGYAIYCERLSGDTLYLDPHYQAPAPVPAGPEIWSMPITAFVDDAPIGRVAIGVVDAPAQIAQSYDSRSLGMFTRTSAILIADPVRGKFVRQVLPRSSDVQKWILAMAPSETGGMSLAWGSQQPPEPGQKVLLRDVLYDRVVDMAVQPAYSVTNAAQMPAGRLVIYLGDSAAVMRAVSEPMRAIPNGYRLYQNYPNPFNPTTTLAFDLPVSSHVELVIFNILGERVRTLVSEMRPAGSYVIPWNSRDDRGQSVASGVYFARLLAGARAVTIKMALVK